MLWLKLCFLHRCCKFEWDFCFEIGLNGGIKANWTFPRGELRMTAVLRSECSTGGEPRLSSLLYAGSLSPLHFLCLLSSFSFESASACERARVPGSDLVSKVKWIRGVTPKTDFWPRQPHMPRCTAPPPICAGNTQRKQKAAWLCWGGVTNWE